MEKRSVAPIIIRGVILIVLGILIMFYSEDSIKALGLLPGLFITVLGVAQIGFATLARKNLAHWQWYLAGGIGTGIIGVILMLNPEFTLRIIIIGFGAWFLFQGIQDFSASQYWRKWGHPNWKFMLLGGIFNVIIGLLFVFNPTKGAMAVTAFIGLGMISGGIAAIIVGNFLRHKFKEMAEHKTPDA